MTRMAEIARAMPAHPSDRAGWYMDRLRDVDLASCHVRVDIRCGLSPKGDTASPCNNRVGLVYETPLGPMLVVHRRSVFEEDGKRFVVPTEHRDLLNEDRRRPWLEDSADDGLLEVVCRTHGPLETPSEPSAFLVWRWPRTQGPTKSRAD